MLVTVDMPRENVASFRGFCYAHGIEIQNFEEEGPGGGNPCFHLLVDDRGAMIELANFYWGKED